MTKRLKVLVLSSMLLALAACGGGGDDADDSAAATTTTAKDAAAATSTTADAAEVPDFSSNFDRVCTTQVGYPGVTSYEPGPGPHKVILFEEYEPDSYSASSNELPKGWKVEEDSNFEDNSELKAIELVACSDRLKEKPTGKICEFDSDGDKVKLELVDATYELKIYAATTGKELSKSTIEASEGGECPMFATFKKGDKTYISTPSDDQYTNGLKPIVAP